MKCTQCSRTMSALFTSFYCQHCDGPTSAEGYEGYIVYQPDRIADGKKFYVFPTMVHAALWRKFQSLEQCEIRQVKALEPITWHRGRGQIDDLMLATERYEVFPDHRYEPKPCRAHLAEGVEALHLE